jgi:Zn-dependent peptidase ImmA (M78 family)/ribosome-binding protein aMBF1 (putative translation factor)
MENKYEKSIQVTRRDDRSWAVVREGNSRASSLHQTQKSATVAAKELSQRYGGSLVIHGRDGRVRFGAKAKVASGGRTVEPEASDKKQAFAKTLGERLTSARKMRGFSLRGFAEALNNVSHTTLQKYEKATAPLDTNILGEICRVLDLRMSYFLKKPTYSYSQVEWRKSSKIGKKVQQQLEFDALDYFERYLEVERLLGLQTEELTVADFSKSPLLELPKKIEALAERLREKWGLGTNPIPNVHSMLEEHGFKVRILPSSGGFDGLSSFLAGADFPVPVIALSDEYWKGNKDLPRFRFTALHELGHLVMKLPLALEHRAKESCCHRFASAFLFPRQQFLSALGTKRVKIAVSTGTELKATWGMSIAALMRRAKDLEVITEGAYKGFSIWSSKSGFRKREPQSWQGYEGSQRFKRLVLQGFNESIITSSKAADFLGISLGELSKEADSLI